FKRNQRAIPSGIARCVCRSLHLMKDMTSTPSLEGSKYQLKNLHAEIDLLDRRLAHMEKYDTFATDAAKAAATRKLIQKRKPVEESARRMAAEGVEYLQ